MRSKVIEKYGDPDVFVWRESSTPTPMAGQVLVAVKAASVNPVDLMVRSGAAPLNPPMPATLGCDVAGVVEAVGPGGCRFRVGDRVFGCVGGVGAHQGTYATHVLADNRLLARMPDAMSFQEGAALPLVTITAAEGIDDKAKVQPGQSVLVFGGTGGVGHVAVQWAKARGAVVHTTASSESKAALARSLGADAVHNHREVAADAWAKLAPGGAGYDIVFDTVGGPNLETSLQAVRRCGHLVTTVSLGATDLSLVHMHSLTLSTVFMLIPLLHGEGLEAHGRILEEAARLYTARRLRPIIDASSFSLDAVDAAHQHLADGKAIGKVLITI